MTPAETVRELDKYIIGQDDAKRAVALALRNRWRRSQIEPILREEISPKNILMIGSTGIGKTEIARRLAKLVNAPFIKVEATKYTEVGYVGRDVDAIIRDLTENGVKTALEQARKEVAEKAKHAALERILDVLVPPAHASMTEVEKDNNPARPIFRKQLEEGTLDDQEIEIELALNPVGVEIMAPPGMEEMTNQLQSLFQQVGGTRTKTRKLLIAKARELLQEEEAEKCINQEEVIAKAIENVEQNGIVFIDELDKVAKRAEQGGGGDVSREGVQRDLLPLVEGTSVSTKYGVVKSDHILFIAAGAFQVSKPSDLIPELQGRFPIRVELNALTEQDFIRILTEPQASLTIQYRELLATEGLALHFEASGIQRIAEIALHINEKMENIGARRLYTVMEKLLENASFETHEKDANLLIDRAYVDSQLNKLVADEDLGRYIL